MRRPGEAQKRNGRSKRRIVDDDEEEEYNPVKGEPENYDTGEGDRDYDYGDDDEDSGEENAVRPKKEEGVNANAYGNGGGGGGGVVQDRTTKELVRYMVGAHSQGRVITREKLEALMISVKLFDEKESRKGQKLAVALEKCVPYLRNVFGYRMVPFDKTLQSDPTKMDYKEKEILLQTCLPDVYNEANGSDHARAPASDEVFMAYVVACLVALVANLGIADFTALNQYLTSVGLGQCLHKGKLKSAGEMLGLLCKNDYLNLFLQGGATLPMVKEVGAAKPSARNVVLKECKDLGLGHRDSEKVEIALGPKMYYEFSTLAVLEVFESIKGEDNYRGLEKKIAHCRFEGPPRDKLDAEGDEQELDQENN
ncbi:hypothetical protein CJU90_2625 [Yarrowia sp. C11]|nr:hypothetical protein CKK34_4073 [Yarrowia sp. E02]KAG5369178.1 hypothetical protein CJU90_2625 [Yarrowia sp. C11]